MSDPTLSVTERLTRFRSSARSIKRPRPAPLRVLTEEEIAALAALSPIQRLAAVHRMQREPPPPTAEAQPAAPEGHAI